MRIKFNLVNKMNLYNMIYIKKINWNNFKIKTINRYQKRDLQSQIFIWKKQTKFKIGEILFYKVRNKK